MASRRRISVCRWTTSPNGRTRRGGPVRPTVPTAAPSSRIGSVRLPALSEREAVLDALRDAGGNRSKAAQTLGIGRTTLYRKLREFGID